MIKREYFTRKREGDAIFYIRETLVEHIRQIFKRPTATVNNVFIW